MASMPILVFLADHPELLLVTCSSIGSHEPHFAYFNGLRYRDARDFKKTIWIDDLEAVEQKEKPDWYHNELAPEVPKNSGMHRWIQADWLVQHNRGKSNVDDRDNPDNHWSWYDRPYRMIKKGREVVEKHRAEYAEYVVKQEAKRKEIERLVIVKDDIGYGHNRKYGFLVRVLRETKSRLYVERVRVEGDPSWGYHSTLHGRRGHEYVTREDVAIENVTESEYTTMRSVEGNHLKWLSGLKQQEEAELETIRERYRERREQNQYAFEDELREALDRVKNNGT